MKADLILTNGRIYTLDPVAPWAEAVACHQGKIIAVGTTQKIQTLAGTHTQRLDAQGRLVLPGFTDAHIHFLDYSIRRQQVSLFGLRSIEAACQKVAEAVRQTPPGEWVVGWGWDELHWGTTPTAAHLDAIAPHNPVVLTRMDMHTCWVNSAALRLANITRHTPDPIQAKIERDANGHPLGLLREWNALALLDPFIPKPDASKLQGWMQEAIAEMHRFGVTAVHDQRVEHEGQQSLRLWQALRRQGQLNLRVHCHIAADFLKEAATLGIQPGLGDDRLWLGHAKTFADGTMGSRTAWMLQPFENQPHNLGVVVTPPDELLNIAALAAEAGFALSVHAIGDRAVREVLDVMAERETADSAASLPIPHRIEHVQVIHPADLPRLRQSNLMVSAQPVHLLTDWGTADSVWGARARYAYAFRSLLDNGARLVFGSDAPVASTNPLWGIYAAVTRQDDQGKPADGWYPQERLTVAEAIAGYTTGPAHLAGKSHLQGSITPGKWADMVVWSHNLFEVDPSIIPQVTAELTIFDGQVVNG